MIFGAQYERIPNPRPEEWERDLIRMKEMGLTVARTWLYWRAVQEGPDDWDFSHYDRLLDAAARHGVGVQIQIMLESAPQFLIDRHPEWRYRNAAGERHGFYAFAAQQIGGSPGFDYTHPEARAAAEEYMRRVARRYANHPGLWGYDVWNEFWYTDWLSSDTCQARRVEYLRGKYGVIEALNRAYVTRYTDFGQVTDLRDTRQGHPPSRYTHYMEEMAFHNHMLAELCRWRVDVIRGEDAVHPITGHHGGNPVYYNGWELSRPLDQWGLSRHGDTLDDFLLPMCCGQATAQGKPWWLAENGSGSTWTSVNSRMRSVHFLESTFVMCVMLQAAGMMLWQYRPEIKDAESPNFGIVKLNGEPTCRSRMAADFIRMYRRHEDLFSQAQADPPQVGLVFSPEAFYMDCTVESGLMRDYAGWHAALAQNGCLPAVLRDADLAGAIPPNIRMLILPMQIIEPPGLRDALSDWVRAGGTLVASGQTFLFDHDMYAQREYPGRALFGVNEDETAVYDGDVVCFGAETGRVSLPSGTRRVDCTLDGARPIGAIGGRVAATVRYAGRGKAVWFGCAPGRAHDYARAGGLCSVVSSLLADADCLPGIRSTGTVVTHTLRNGRRTLLFVINMNKTPADAWITFGKEEGDVRIGEMIRNESYGRVSRAHGFPVSLEAEQSGIFLIEEQAPE